jgi:hypothetical protein
MVKSHGFTFLAILVWFACASFGQVVLTPKAANGKVLSGAVINPTFAPFSVNVYEFTVK